MRPRHWAMLASRLLAIYLGVIGTRELVQFIGFAVEGSIRTYIYALVGAFAYLIAGFLVWTRAAEWVAAYLPDENGRAAEAEDSSVRRAVTVALVLGGMLVFASSLPSIVVNLVQLIWDPQPGGPLDRGGVTAFYRRYSFSNLLGGCAEALAGAIVMVKAGTIAAGLNRRFSPKVGDA